MRWIDSQRPLDRWASAGAIAASVAVFVLAFTGSVALLPGDYITHSDVPLYYGYGSEIVGGAVPYRDFALEYPPGALPLFVLPATKAVAGGSIAQASWQPMNAAAERYHRGFDLLLVLLGAVTVTLTGLSLAALRRPAAATLLGLSVVALSPLLLGDVFPERFDIWPAALTAAALAAATRFRYRLAGAALGLGSVAKLYPVLLIPVLAIAVARHRGLREAGLVTAIAVVSAAAVVLPFALASAQGTWRAIRIQFEGGLQIESLGSAVLVMASLISRKLDALGLNGFTLTDRAAEHGLSRGVLVGPGTDATATVLNLILAAALISLWVSLARSTGEVREDLVRYAAGAVATAVALGSVLSPQYLIWLVPLIPLVGGRRGVTATLALVVAALLTHLWFPWGYFKYARGLELGPTTLLLVRNLALLAIPVVLLLPPRRLGSSRSRPA